MSAPKLMSRFAVFALIAIVIILTMPVITTAASRFAFMDSVNEFLGGHVTITPVLSGVGLEGSSTGKKTAVELAPSAGAFNPFAAQNDLAPGDIAIVSYQSDFDPTNTFTVGLAEFEDRFSIVVLRPGGIDAGTVIFFTTRGWSAVTNTWHDFDYTPTFGLGRLAVVQWTVPAGGIAQGTEIFFINKFHDEIASPNEYYDWAAYSDQAGTILLNNLTNVTPIVPAANGTDGMGLTFSGDHLLVYQTGSTAGPTGGFNGTPIRFITALLANNNGTTTYAAWDPVPTAAVNSDSSLPPGLVNGQTAFLMSPGPLPATSTPTNEPDNGKFSACALSLAGTTTTLQMSTLIYTVANWTYNNSVFPLGQSSGLCTYSFITPPLISKAFAPTTIQSGGTSTVTLTLSNPNGVNLTNGSFTDTLTNMSAAGGSVAGTCAGTTPSTLSAGATALSFSGITIPANGSCTVIFSVTSSLAGVRPNTTSGVTTTQASAGNASNTANLTVVTPPTTVTSINRQTPTAQQTNLASVTYRITFANAVAGLAAANLSLNESGGTCTGESIGTPVTVGGGSSATQWDVPVNTGTTGDCVLRLDLVNDGGLSHDIPAFNTGESYNIDKTPPATTSFLRLTPSTSPTNADTLFFRVNFSEFVTGLDTTDFTVTGTTATVTSVGGASCTPPNCSAYDVMVSGGDLATVNGVVGLNFNAAAPANFITDLASNNLPNTEPVTDQTYVLDNLAPTVDITDVTPDPRNTAVTSIAINFNENVTGFDLADLTLTLNGGGNLLTGAQTITGGPQNYTLNNLGGLTTAEGTYLLTLTAPGGIVDAAGNALIMGATDSWVMDSTAPTVTINQASGQNDPTPNNPINFTVIFSDPVTDFDDTADVTVSGTAAGSPAVTITPVSTTEYTVSINGITGDGTVIVTVNAGAAVDAAGNANTASTSTDNTVTFITSAVPPAGMVAWYTGDGHANDIAGGNDGSISGTVNYGAGKVGDAFSFGGSGFVTAGATTPADLNISGNAVTIDGWVYPTTASPTGHYFGHALSGQNHYALLYSNGNVEGYIQTVGQGEAVVSTGFTPPINTWTHLALVYNGTDIKVYANGTQVGPTVAKTGNVETSPDSPFNIGGRADNFNFNGMIDEVEVFGVALAESDIDAIVAADSGGKCKPVDLSIVKADPGTPIIPGGTAVYTLSYANYGAAASGVVITETVPANTTFSAGPSTPGWSCANGAPASTVCTFAVGSLPTLATGSVVFGVLANNPIAAGVTEISNTASIAGGSEMDTADNSSTDTTPVTAQPDLSLTKSDGGVSVAPGGTVAYTLTVTNSGNQGATGVVLTETVPANTTFNAGASTAGWACLPNNNAGSTCTLAVAGAVAGGGGTGGATFAVTVVNPVAAGVNQISNSASVADDGANGTDPTLPNTASDTTPVNAAPDLTIDKDDGGVSVVPGGTVSYTLNYSNVGDQGATGVVITETVPLHTTFNSVASIGSWVCLPDNTAGSTCTLAVGALNAGSGSGVTFAVDVDTTGLLGITDISNTASIADDGTNGVDPNLPNTSTDTTTRNCQTITVNNPTNAAGTIGLPFSETFTQTGGFGTVTFSTASPLPSGFTLSSAGVLSGTTNQTGTFPITVTATDGNGCTGTSITYNLQITCNTNPVVLNNADNGDDSLRWAVATACPGSTITFNMGTVGSSIGISGEMLIQKDLTIQGPGADLLTVQATGSRIFTIQGSGVDVNISGLTLTGGNGTGSFFGNEGGAIQATNASMLTLDKMTITGNSTVTGGGVAIDSGSTLVMTNSTVDNNTATGTGVGGGIFCSASTCTISNSTISGNTANTGGGLYSGFSTTLLTSVTVAGNTAQIGGGLRESTPNILFGASLTIGNTIVADNTASVSGPDVSTFLVVPITSNGYNLIENTSGATIGGNTATNISGDPQLGPLQGNGGTTETHALAPGSPAVDQGSAFGATTDQRGSSRPFNMPVANADDGSDIGAYELNTAPTTTTVSSSNNPSVWGETVTFTATVETDPGGAPVTVGNVDFSLDGNPVLLCQDVAVNVSGEAQCMIAGLTVGTHTVFAEYDENLPFLASSGSLTPVQTVNNADTTIVITGDTPDPTLVGDPYTVTWTVAVVSPGGGTPTGTVTITDGTGGTCTAPVATGFCTMTSTTVGVKNLVATYSGDGNFNGSVSAAVQHTSAIIISGNIRQAPGMTPLSGITVTLSGNNGQVTLTNSNGDYTFFGAFTGNYTVTPSGPIPGKSYDPITRSITNITGHTTGINFVAYNISQDAPRKLRVISQFAVPGDAAAVPVTVESQGNETSISFSIEYDPTKYSAPPTVSCGTDAGPGCTITTNYTEPGRVGIRVVPASGPLAAGTREIVILNFQTVPTLASNTPIDLIASPTNITATNANGDLLLVELHSGGVIVMQQGFEGDVANNLTGDGQVLSNDVIMMRQFAVGTRAPNPLYNEFQRVDIAPSGTKGDGMVTSGDVIQARRYAAGISTVTGAGGPFVPMTGAAPPAMLIGEQTPRMLRAMPTNGVAGYKVTVPVEMKTTGDEMAVSFTIEYDAAKFAAPKVALAGVAPADAVLTVNDSVSGHLTILIDSGTPFLQGAGQLVNVTFDVAQTASSGETKITIRGGSVSDSEANELPSAYASGTVTINGANAPGVSISGRVLTTTGGGLRNAQVTITDANGARRTVVTSSTGYYQFDEVTTGREYRISVSSRRYRYPTRTVDPSADLANVDFNAME